MPRFPKLSLSPQKFNMHLSSPHMACLSHPFLFHHSNSIWWAAQIVRLLIMRISFQSPVTLSLLDPNIFFSTPFETPSAYVPTSTWQTHFLTHNK
jgi:hypothetical protein